MFHLEKHTEIVENLERELIEKIMETIANFPKLSPGYTNETYNVVSYRASMRVVAMLCGNIASTMNAEKIKPFLSSAQSDFNWNWLEVFFGYKSPQAIKEGLER